MLQTLLDDTRTSNVVFTPETPGEAKLLFRYSTKDIPYFGRILSSSQTLHLPTSGLVSDFDKFYESLVGSKWNGTHYSKLKLSGLKLEVVSQEGKLQD